ncbi:hypothetical protein Taro_038832 [Colocasia esculenta]|uniref:HTH myb-type domain-containing protein n=1 Tax=Colocasia esculenta TaxID=4460 RepID=A0A843W7R4_COLES|nr:hypothetical protein [Colocasia esculenta]
MVSSSELSLDYKPNGYSSTAQKPFVDGQDHQPEQQHQKLEEFLARLEEERLKIEAFKRELPLCMQLLNNAMESYRHQLEMCHTNQGNRPVLEEFIPLKHAANAVDEVSEKTPPAANVVPCEKASWMTTAQLWSPADGTKQHADHGLDNGNSRLGLDAKQRNGGAFLPFTRERGRKVRSSLPEFELAPVEKRKEERKCSDVEVARRPAESFGAKGGGVASGVEQGKGTPGTAANPAADGGQAAATQTQRKARRCWSPDLHRRFVNALQMLGGSQVATPKQIRELMKVDGLTNDEVKSHLQKYRLHTRRPISGPQGTMSAASPQLVVLGGIWVPPEYATTAAAATAPGIFGGHPPPTHYCTAPVPQDFYPAPLQGAHHRQLPPPPQRVLSTVVATVPSGPAGKVKREPSEAEVRGGGDSSESIEEGEEEGEGDQEVAEEEEEEGGRSESKSWKRGDEKALVPVREEGEVGHDGNEVDLKF